MKPLFALLAGLFALSATARADVFDRIDQCERAGGGSCVYDILREIAREGHGGHEDRLQSGTYKSESYEVSVGTIGNTVTLTGSSSISEAGTYTCTGTHCTGPGSYSFDMLSTTQFKMNYGRVWTHQ